MQKDRYSIEAWIMGILLVASTALAAEPDGEWPGWRGPNRDGKSTETGLLAQWPEAGLQLLWKVDGLGDGYSSVAVSGGSVYITGMVDGNETIFAFGLDGKRLWSTEADTTAQRGPKASRATPTIDDGRLYLLSGNALLGCFDAATGRQIWASDLKQFGGKPGGWGYAESVLIYHDLAVAKSGGENCIVALDKQTGETRWTSSGFQAGPEYSSCIAFTFEGKPLICTGTGGGLVCVDAENGKLMWSNDFCAGNTANCPTPVYSDGYVFWANGYGRGGICMKLRTDGDAVSADVAWTTKNMICHHGGYIVDQGHIYGNHSGGWACLDLKTGEQLWNERAVGKGSLCYADGMLYLFSETAGVAGLATCSPQGLEMKGQMQVEGSGRSWAHPVVAGGRLYLRYAGNLYCFNVRDET